MNYLTFLLPFTRSRKYKFAAESISPIIKTEHQRSYDFNQTKNEQEYSEVEQENYKIDTFCGTTEMYYENEEVIEENNGNDIHNVCNNGTDDQLLENEVKTIETNENTADWYFLKSLMPDIQSMNATQKRKLRIQIMTIIDNILTEN